jgi:hypothetical protein
METYTIQNSKGQKLRFSTGEFVNTLYWYEGSEDKNGYLKECLKAYRELDPEENYTIVTHFKR